MFVVEIFLVLVAVNTVAAATGGYDHDWSYKTDKGLGPSKWSIIVPHYCSGSSQSPINIDRSKALYNSALKPLVLVNYTKSFPGVTLDMGNNGNTAYAWAKVDNTLSDVPIGIKWNGIFHRFAQFHFHWGKANDRGSEHTIDGKAFPAEMHILHYNVKYPNLTTALKYNDGIIAFGQMIQIDDNGAAHPGIASIIKHFPKITNPGSKFNAPSVVMDTIVAPELVDYYFYHGSLTTPTCDETITWIVNRKYITVTSAQLNAFRQLVDLDTTLKIGDNFRPVQPLNCRVVKKSFSSAKMIMAHPIVISIMSGLILVVMR